MLFYQFVSVITTFYLSYRCKRLPKGLKEWQAYNELKRKIDDFCETLPLLELMANKSMKVSAHISKQGSQICPQIVPDW